LLAGRFGPPPPPLPIFSFDFLFRSPQVDILFSAALHNHPCFDWASNAIDSTLIKINDQVTNYSVALLCGNLLFLSVCIDC
jgi:hypothetical protein